MAPAIALPRIDRRRVGLRNWLRRRSLSLTARILLANILSLALFAGGLFFLDAFRARLLADRADSAARHAAVVARLLPEVPPEQRPKFIAAYGQEIDGRIRLYDSDGRRVADSFALAPPTYRFQNVADEPWTMRAALVIDHVFDFAVGANEPAPYVEPARDVAASWPEIDRARSGQPGAEVRSAPDFTPMVSGAAVTPEGGPIVLVMQNARDVRDAVRAQRSSLGTYFLIVLIVAILLSLFLARTIARPLSRLARAAVRVRRGRAREVAVPRLPERRDEIGMLARALSDMSTALRNRIDSTEAFAADVAHEIKNPLASLRSALDALEGIEDPELRKRLMAVAQDDVHRLDRLISDISDASRLDAQLSRAQFEPVDLGEMIEGLLSARTERGSDGETRVAFARPPRGLALVMGEGVRLERVIGNLIDNAVSFSPPGGLVAVAATANEYEVLVRVEDEGPGVPAGEREAIFRRFHSARPGSEPFGRHSGLGLAIARTIVEGHQGRIRATDRPDGARGAMFEIWLPRAGAPAGTDEGSDE